MIFLDRYDAGRQLARRLLKLSKHPNTIVLGLACGGLPLAFEIAQTLHLGFYPLIVRKIRAPQNADLSLGAIAEQDIKLLHSELISILDIPKDYIKKEIENQKIYLAKQCALYNTFDHIPYHKHILLVDDGMATGSSMQVAIRALEKYQASSIHVAIPIASRSSLTKISKEIQTTCLFSPSTFKKLSNFYRVFDPISDLEALDLVNHSRHNLVATIV